jgi:hypothetical protein
MKKKICSKCNEEKEVCEFNLRKTSKDGYRQYCKKCHLEYSQKYVNENKEKCKMYQDVYHSNNVETHRLKSSEYYQNNKEKVHNYLKTKYHTDSLFKLKISVRNRINIFLKKKNITKNNSTFNIIGCSPESLKEHLRNQFKEGMSWENHGLYGWHIDHIIPLSSAKTEEEMYKFCHYTNLQPLWCADNLSKGDKILV